MVSEVAFQAVHAACDPLGAVNMRSVCTERVATPPEGGKLTAIGNLQLLATYMDAF